MTDEPLKTLKEIVPVSYEEFGPSPDYEHYEGGYNDAKRDLRAEAVRWVKYINTYVDDVFEAQHTRGWIMHFFNLTEEDLK